MAREVSEDAKQQGAHLALGHLDEDPNLSAARQNVSSRIGVASELLRRWVCQTQVDSGQPVHFCVLR